MAAIAAHERPQMSQQLTLSSLFSVLALAGLCVTISARDLAGVDAPVAAQSYAPSLSVQAELAPGLHG